MNYENNKMKDINIAYIGGGSRGWAWTFMTDLSLEPNLSGTIKLYDINKEAAKNNEIIGNKITAMESSSGKWLYKAVDTLEDALTGSDFVVISILPGTFDEMDVDVHLPEKYGIYQSVGDTVGPGGMMRAFRTIPMFKEIAEAIKEHAPDAWVINYTNPMSLCVKTLYDVFPNIKAFGCCHEVFGTQKVLKGICEEALGIDNIPREDIHVNVLGVNHFTWFDRASYKGLDLFPLYKDYIERTGDEGFEDDEGHWANSTFACAHLVKFDLFKRYGYIAAAGDRHLAEFMPLKDYLRDEAMVKRWKFSLTTVDWRKKDLEEKKAKSERLVCGEDVVEQKHSGEEGIRLIKALCGLERVVSNVNIPNTHNQITNLPTEAIVETNAVFEKDAIRPMIAGEIPKSLLPLIKPHVVNQQLIHEAATKGDIYRAIDALLNEPMVSTKLNRANARKMLLEMIEGTKAYLPELWK